MSVKSNPFKELSNLIDKYAENKDQFDVESLQSIREDISLCLFYLSSDYAKAISNFDRADWERKRNYAELIEQNKFAEDGSKNTVVQVESLARIANKDKEEEVVEAIRQKERARLIVSSTTQILNAISSKIQQLNKH
jgi:hypothetical protein